MTTVNTEFVVNKVIACSRQQDKHRKPYAAIKDGNDRTFFNSHFKFRTPTEVEGMEERHSVTGRLSSLPPGAVVETRDSRDCSHSTEYRDVFTKIDTDTWQRETVSGSNRHGFRR